MIDNIDIKHATSLAVQAVANGDNEAACPTFDWHDDESARSELRRVWIDAFRKEQKRRGR